MPDKESIRDKLIRRFYTRFKPEAERDGTMRTLAANGQNPDVLIVSCIDSRVSASMIFKAQPGEILNHRHIAGLVPPYNPEWEKPEAIVPAVVASVDFAIRDLKVDTIIVKGHTHCGGVRACVENTASPAVKAWMSFVKPAFDRLDRTLAPEALLREAERACTKYSYENLLGYPAVREAMARGALSVEAWMHDIGNSALLRLDPDRGVFVKMDESANAVTGKSAIAG